MNVLKTWEEKAKKASSRAQPPLKFSSFIKHQRYHVCRDDAFKMGTGPGAATALLPAPSLLHQRPGVDTTV